jgi:polar amino acid transport system permease protein
MRQTWIHIILPQAMPPMAPPLANCSCRYLEPVTLVGVFFLLVSIPSVILLRWLEHRYGRIEE